MGMDRFGQKIMLPTNTLNNCFLCIYISERYYKCKLIVAHSYQISSYVDVAAYVHRILQNMCGIRR